MSNMLESFSPSSVAPSLVLRTERWMLPSHVTGPVPKARRLPGGMNTLALRPSATAESISL